MLTCVVKFLLVVFIVFCFPSLSFCKEKVVRIGVLANLGAKESIKRWTLTAQYLQKKIPQYRFEIEPFSFEEISKIVKEKSVDFIICNPGIFVDLEATDGATGIATVKAKVNNNYYNFFGGVIFTRPDTDIYTIGDLKGKRFVAVDEDSFGGWLAAWREINRAGINPWKDFKSFSFAGQHDTAVYAVLSGEADAGTCRTDVLETLMEEGKIDIRKLRIIAGRGEEIEEDRKKANFILSTRLYPGWVFAKMIDAPKELAEEVTRALLDMKKDDPAAIAADSGGWTYSLNYQPVQELKRELGIGVYKNQGQITFRNVLKKYRAQIIFGSVIFMLLFFCFAVVLMFYKRLVSAKRALDSELSERIKIEADLRTKQNNLQEALSEVKALSGLLPICASCKKIRDDRGYWEQIEVYIKDHSNAEFSHGICPECIQKLYPEIADKMGLTDNDPSHESSHKNEPEKDKP